MKACQAFNLVLIALLFSPIVLQFANATPYVWNTTPIDTPWQTIARGDSMTISDIDRDGIGDAVFTRSTTTMTKQFGDWGASSFSITGVGIRDVLAVKENLLLTFGNTGATSCSITSWNGYQYDLHTGTQISALPLHATGGSGNPLNSYSGIITTNNKTMLFCVGTVNAPLTVFTSNEPTMTNYTDAVLYATVYGPFQIHSAVGRVFTYNVENYTNATGSASTYFHRTPTNTPSGTPAFTIPAGFFVDNRLVLYKDGLYYPQQSFINETLLASRLTIPSSTDSISLLINLPPRILNSAFTSPVYLRLENSTGTYLAAMQGTTLYITPYDSLVTTLTNNRAFANYRIDPSQTMITRAITSALPASTSISLIFSNGTIASPTVPVQTILPTGYAYQAPSINRYYYPDFTNSLIYIPTAGFVAGSSLTIQINNAPPDAAIMFTNTTQYNSTGFFNYFVTFLQADDTTTVEIPANVCGYVYVRDTAIVTPVWSNLGLICNNGINPKVLPYTLSLPLTFWTLQYGASHTYTPTTSELSTLVRSSTIPFTYTAIVRNSTGAVAINQTFVSGSAMDAQNFNVSSVTKPASLSILVGSSQIYSAI